MPAHAWSGWDSGPRGFGSRTGFRPDLPGEPFTASEQLTPRIAATANASASLSLLAPKTRLRVLALLEHVADLAELVPSSSASWDAEREETGALALFFGGVAVRYRIDDTDASLLIEEVATRLWTEPDLSMPAGPG